MFDRRVAEGDLRRYERRGPDRPTRVLLAALAERVPVTGASLLDVGGGIGVIARELLDLGVTSVTAVEASESYLAVAQTEAEKHGYASRMTWRHGDFVELAADIADADLVTLDRVVCCYPDCERLLIASSARCRVAYALSYPRERWYVKIVMAFENLLRRFKGSAFRVFVHPDRTVEATLRAAGLEPLFHGGTPVWNVAIYVRSDAAVG